MNISIAQALATVLNIQVEEVPDSGLPKQGRQAFVMGMLHLGYCDSVTLDQAVCKAVIEIDLKQPSNFAIFPIGSGRENIYMAIERELLRQEQALGGRMWEKLGNDPRELVTLVMEQLREAAIAVINPTSFQIAILRTCCLLIACMTWISDWIARLKMKVATMQQQRQQDSMPPPIPVVGMDVGNSEAPVILFGAGGVGAIHVVPDPKPIESAVDLPQECMNCGVFNKDEAEVCDACGVKMYHLPSEEALHAEREALGHDKPEPTEN